MKTKASQGMNALTQRTKAQLEDALKNHKTVDMNVFFDVLVYYN